MKTLKKQKLFIKGFKEFKNSNNPCTYIFVADSWNSEEQEIPIMIKVNKIYKEINFYNQIYVNNVLSINILKNKKRETICQVEVDDVEFVQSSLIYEDYYELSANDMNIWYSPL